MMTYVSIKFHVLDLADRAIVDCTVKSRTRNPFFFAWVCIGCESGNRSLIIYDGFMVKTQEQRTSATANRSLRKLNPRVFFPLARKKNYVIQLTATNAQILPNGGSMLYSALVPYCRRLRKL